MSMFEDSHYRWRETYFVLFDSQKRPSVEQVEENLAALNNHFELSQRPQRCPTAASSR